MKKVIIQMVAAVVCVCLVSCGGGSGSSGGGSSNSSNSSSPSSIADKVFSAWLKGDMKTVATYVDQEGLSAKELKEGLEFLTEMLKYQPLAKYEIQGETLSDDGKKAKVNVKLYFKDGDTSDNKVPFVKTDHGWKISDIMGW